MKTNKKLTRIRLLNYVFFGESKREDFNETEVKTLRQTPLNEVRKELRETFDSYLDELYDKCEKKSKSKAMIPNQ